MGDQRTETERLRVTANESLARITMFLRVEGLESLLAEAELVRDRLAEFAEKTAKYDAINTPELYDFVAATINEALHQRERWGVEADGGKTDADWFWLIGYLAGKALHNPPKDNMGSVDARLHRIITVAAAAANWHGATLGTYPQMRPGVAPPVDP